MPVSLALCYTLKARYGYGMGHGRYTLLLFVLLKRLRNDRSVSDIPIRVGDEGRNYRYRTDNGDSAVLNTCTDTGNDDSAEVNTVECVNMCLQYY
jgi:hypothetical protein